MTPPTSHELVLWRAIAKTRPCPHCHAQPGDACRAEAGRGPELVVFVHPARAAGLTTPTEDR